MKQLTPKFDPARIVFSFGAISDWHIRDEEGQYNQKKLISALTQLKAKAEVEKIECDSLFHRTDIGNKAFK